PKQSTPPILSWAHGRHGRLQYTGVAVGESKSEPELGRVSATDRLSMFHGLPQGSFSGRHELALYVAHGRVRHAPLPGIHRPSPSVRVTDRGGADPKRAG